LRPNSLRVDLLAVGDVVQQPGFVTREPFSGAFDLVPHRPGMQRAQLFLVALVRRHQLAGLHAKPLRSQRTHDPCAQLFPLGRRGCAHRAAPVRIPR
jgi:hypothetical protein